MQIKLSFVKDPILLPKRFEILEREVEKRGGELTKIVKKIESADRRIQDLLGRISVGGVGQFQLFLGRSGSGKTTFLRTLPNFFENIHIESFDKASNFDDVINRIEEISDVRSQKILVIDEKDNPEIHEGELRTFFEKLRVIFRTSAGNVLIIWPITDDEAAKTIGDIAWKVGADSVCPLEGAVYNFSGLPKSDYFDVADITIRNLNNGESLESYGITKDPHSEIYVNSNTIGDFYSRIERLAFENNRDRWKILEQKAKPKVWIVLPGDSMVDLDRTVSSLTQGVENRVDVDRMCAYLDDESNTSTYLNDWRKRRGNAGFLFRFLDVRLFSMSPNLALSAIRAYGDESVTSLLKRSSEAKKSCNDKLRKSDVYLAILNQSISSKRIPQATKPDTQYEYIRLQQTASRGDKELNKSVSKAIENLLYEDGYDGFNIKTEKQELKGTNLKPDIMIDLGNDEILCLEFTWRSTGKEVVGEIAPRQNTLTPGHIQKYLLEKVMEYVKELGI